MRNVEGKVGEVERVKVVEEVRALGNAGSGPWWAKPNWDWHKSSGLARYRPRETADHKINFLLFRLRKEKPGCPQEILDVMRATQKRCVGG